MVETPQSVKDYQLTVEYKHLRVNGPGGVFVIPRSLREWEGVIFVRRGMYAGGIFKFVLTLPIEYNAKNAWPRIRFLTRVFSPYVDDKGELDIRAAYPSWDPSCHYVVTALTFLKRIFYVKQGSFEGYDENAANKRAAEIYRSDPPEFLRSVEQCVAESVANVYDSSAPRFHEGTPGGKYDRLRDALYALPGATNKKADRYDLLAAQSQHAALLDTSTTVLAVPESNLPFADTVLQHIVNEP